MKALILCAGYATRLYPLTLDKPKPLLEIAGKPMLEHIIDKLKDIEEIDTIYVVTNDKFYSNFEEWRKNLNFNKNIKIVNDLTTNNESRLGAVGDVKFVIEKENVDDDLLVFGGDNLFEDNLNNINLLFKEKKASVVGFKDVGDIEIAKRMGIALLDDNKKIIEFVEKPPEPKSTLVSALVYFLAKKDLMLIDECLASKKEGEEVKAGELIAYMIEKTDVYGYIFKGIWFDIGNHEQLKEADEYWRKKE